MTRLSGIQLLALSLALWALAVWIFGASPPASTETTAGAPDAGTEESGIGANEPVRAEAATAPSSAALANQGSTASPNPDPGAGGSPPRSSMERTGIETASAPSPSGAPAIPSGGVRTAPAATGDGSRAATAPAGGDPTLAAPISPVAIDSESVAGGPTSPRDSAAGSARERAVGPGVPPTAARPQPWFEYPLYRPPPPARSGGPAADGNAVSGQLGAARRAAWEGRLADALAHYRAAARLQPNHYVVWGEMGNVLWTMQRWPEAAYALEGAATLLVQAGELRAANELVPAVGSVDPDAAYRIQRLLWAAAQRQSG